MQLSDLFKKRVTERLDELKWTHDDLARKLGIQRGTVSNYLKESAQPDLQMSTLIRWSTALGVAPGWLLGNESAPSPQENIEAMRLEVVKHWLEADDNAIRFAALELRAAVAASGDATKKASRTKG